MENMEKLGVNAENDSQEAVEKSVENPAQKAGCVSFELSEEVSKKLFEQEHDAHAEDLLKRIEAEAMYNIVREENIRLETERNLYRELYHNLLDKLMGEGA